MTSSKRRDSKRPESSKPPGAKRRFVSDFEVNTYWRYYAMGFDHTHQLSDSSPKWWRKLGL